MNNESPNLNLFLKCIIAALIVITFSGMLFPITSASYSAYYGSIAKNIAISGDFSNLTLANQDWLDKPHLPFWLSAISFKIFGINSFAYILPGFTFHLIGAYYTYKLADYLYHNKTIALISVMVYLSIFHLMISAIDVRAEAYLLGEIMPASYYWLKYDRKFSWRNLLLASFFTALALMSKGLFVIVTIVSGLLGLWFYERRLINLIRPKWWLGLLLALALAFPEYIALYLQFDAHPEKIVFGHNNVSGLRWFFIDSQFGRFFNTGYIMSTDPMAYHQLFFVHTFLWAFLPWSLIFPVAVYQNMAKFRANNSTDKTAFIILISYFFISFIMFSLTIFQVDHYTNIIFPFAAILSAKLLYDIYNKKSTIHVIQISLASLILVLAIILSWLIFSGWVLLGLIILAILIVGIMVKFYQAPSGLKNMLLSGMAIGHLFVTFNFANGYIYHKYDPGFLVARYTNQNPHFNVVDYNLDSEALEFYTKGHYYKFAQIKNFATLAPFYLAVPAEDQQKIYQQFKQAKLVATVMGNKNEQVFPHLLNLKSIDKYLNTYAIFLIEEDNHGNSKK